MQPSRPDDRWPPLHEDDDIVPVRATPADTPCPACHGEGELEVCTRRDEFGVWDTEFVLCGDCGGSGIGATPSLRAQFDALSRAARTPARKDA